MSINAGLKQKYAVKEVYDKLFANHQLLVRWFYTKDPTSSWMEVQRVNETLNEQVQKLKKAVKLNEKRILQKIYVAQCTTSSI